MSKKEMKGKEGRKERRKEELTWLQSGSQGVRSELLLTMPECQRFEAERMRQPSV